MKYIMLKIVESEFTRLVPVIFPNSIVHADMARAVQSIPGMELAVVESAGECRVKDAFCSGASDTLQVKSHGQDDSIVINGMDYFHGIV